MSLVYLLGMRAAGKSTVGKMAAEHLGISFVDMDAVLEERLHQSTTDFIGSIGEAAFRTEEAKLLCELEEKVQTGALKKALIATGGGIVDGEESRKLLQSSFAEKLFLEVPLEQLWERISADSERKRVGNLQSLSALEALYRRREPHFLALATHKISVPNEASKAALSIENYYQKLS